MSSFRRILLCALWCTVLLTFMGCSADAPTPTIVVMPRYDGPNTVTLDSPFTKVVFDLGEDFRMRILTDEGRVVLETAAPSFGLTHRATKLAASFIEGYDHAIPTDDPMLYATRASRVEVAIDKVDVDLFAPNQPSITLNLVVRIINGDVSIEAKIIDRRPNAGAHPMNLTSQSFVLRPDEQFVGLGEREASVNHRGRHYQCWTEEGGLSEGEGTPTGPTNPQPNGPGMTHLPIPFLLSSYGYGLWLDTTYRSGFVLGAEDPLVTRIYTEEPQLRYRVFVAANPRYIIERYTALVGRALLPAPWVFGPRRRVDIGKKIDGVDEALALRWRGVPTTVVDDSVHFLPNADQAGQEQALAQRNVWLHSIGFKAISYFNPHVSATIPHAAGLLAEGRRRDAFVRLDDGSEFLTFMISAGGQKVATIDLTKPTAIDWYQGLLQQALDLGYDGWMLDFGEYLPQHAKLYNGMSGWEAHNLFPLIYQRVTFDYLRSVRGNDFLFFARSGYTGTQAVVPVVWSGDPSSSFDNVRGLPAHVRAGIGAGLSGIPFWGSDISGYTCLQDPPADKELYLRWAEFGALSSDMHDENACAGAANGSAKWTLWSDAETTKVYGDYARLHTRLFPYLYAAAEEATYDGFPVMRHPLIYHHAETEAWKVEQEYYFGPALYVAPVVTRDARTREFWLPPGTWFDWWTLDKLEGGQRVTRDAPLDRLPLLLKTGGIVPMLDVSVQTLATTDDPSVVDMLDRNDVLDIRAAVDGVERDAYIRLVDGTVLDAVRDTSKPITLPENIRPATDAVDLASCERCGMIIPFRDGTQRVLVSASDLVDLGGLMLAPSGLGPVRRLRWDVLVP